MGKKKRMQTIEGMCDFCKKPCMPLTSSRNKDASEWYCEPCHKSYYMKAEMVEHLLEEEVKKIQGRR